MSEHAIEVVVIVNSDPTANDAEASQVIDAIQDAGFEVADWRPVANS